MTKTILDLCGGTGAWGKPYKDNGYEVINVTLPDYDVRTYKPPDNVYGILAAPPCTMFSFARTRAKKPRDLRSGMELVIACLRIIRECQYRIKKDTQRKPPLKFWALENPYCMINWFLGHPNLIFHPYEYGDGYSKKTCLWGYFNIPPKIGKDTYNKKNIKSIGDIIWKNTKTRQMLRSITPPKFAQAFFEANK